MITSENTPAAQANKTFDWSVFFGREGGHLFQKLCVDLLKAMRMTVRESVRGGHDEGKDIIIFEYAEPNELVPPQPSCFVECKSRHANARALSKVDVAGVFLAIFKHKLNRILIMTNHEFNNELMNYLLDVNCNDHWGVKVTWMERSQLEDSLLANPEVCRAYFRDLPQNEFERKAATAGESGLQRLVADLKPLTPFAGSDNQLRLTVTNNFSEPVDLKVANVGAFEKRTFKFHPFETRVFDFPMPSGSTETWPNLELSGITLSGQAIEAECHIDGRPLIRVDHLYVDPFGYLDRLIALAEEKGCSLVLGSAGSGKSRLLQEVATRISQPVQWIDLSEDSYAGSLSDHLLAAIFRLPRSDLLHLPVEFLEQSLIKRGVGPLDAGTLAELALREGNIDRNAAAETIAAVSCKLLVDQLVIIDNIHRLGPFDTKILQKMCAETSALRLMLSARGNEITRAELSTWVRWLARVQQSKIIDFDNVNRTQVMHAFITASARDERAEQFLKRFAGAHSLQQFVFALKELKAHGFLNQDGDGRFSTGRPSGSIPPRTYEQLYLSLIRAADLQTAPMILRLALDAAAVYGLTIPVEFIESAAGSEVFAAIDELVRLEIFVPLPARSRGGRLIRFDHELTHEIVYNSIGLMRRDSLHRKAADFISDATRFRPGIDSAPLAGHLEQVGAYRDAAIQYKEASNFLRREGQLVETIDALRKAHAAVVQHDDDSERQHLEFAILEDTFRLEQQIGAPVDVLRRTLAALDILALLRGAYTDTRAETGRLLGFRSDIESDPRLARRLAEGAVQALEACGTRRDAGEALVRLGNLAKRDGDFTRAGRLMTRALRMLKGPGLEDLRTTALLDFGAIFLEASRGRKVPLWWGRAVTVATQMVPLDVAVLAHALADQAYASALFRPSEPDTPVMLERAYYMAKQRRLVQTQCRALINWANWCHFHLKDNSRALALVEEAESIANQQGLHYHAALIAFSRLNFMDVNVSPPVETLIAQLRTFLCSPHHIKGSITGDWRMRNMTALLLVLGDKQIWQLARTLDASRWHPFYGIGIGDQLGELERENPYFQGSGYATYY